VTVSFFSLMTAVAGSLGVSTTCEFWGSGGQEFDFQKL
jgi:hypothetical protein